MAVRLELGDTIKPWSHILTITAQSEGAANEFSREINAPRRHSESELLSSGLTDGGLTPATRASTPDCENDSKLSLSFCKPPKDIGLGYVLGSDNDVCDIKIGSRRFGVSGRHLVITFNEKRHVVMRDVSKRGARVSYNGQPLNKRHKGFVWILPVGFTVLVELPPRIVFQIKVSSHQGHESQYFDLLEEYIKRAKESLPQMNNLLLNQATGTSAMTTAVVTPGMKESRIQSETSAQPSVYVLGRKIGAGQFGQVHEVFDASTWTKYAGKGVQIKSMIESEIAALRRLNHEHIVRFQDVFETPHLQILVMEYYARGNLEDEHSRQPLNECDVSHLLHQGMLALAHLHERKIVHRDIKPANILVRCRNPMSIAIADFGLANATGKTFLSTFAGTLLYAAPEMFGENQTDDESDDDSKPIDRDSRSYWESVDLWSLAVVGLEYGYGLPKYTGRKNIMSAWFTKKVILRAQSLLLQRPEDDMVRFLSSILKLDPWDRPVAEECVDDALRLAQRYQTSESTPAILQLPAQLRRIASHTPDVPTLLMRESEFERFCQFEGLRAREANAENETSAGAESRKRKRATSDLEEHDDPRQGNDPATAGDKWSRESELKNALNEFLNKAGR